jgi:hypothetical protein
LVLRQQALAIQVSKEQLCLRHWLQAVVALGLAHFALVQVGSVLAEVSPAV